MKCNCAKYLLWSELLFIHYRLYFIISSDIFINYMSFIIHYFGKVLLAFRMPIIIFNLCSRDFYLSSANYRSFLFYSNFFYINLDLHVLYLKCACPLQLAVSTVISIFIKDFSKVIHLV